MRGWKERKRKKEQATGMQAWIEGAFQLGWNVSDKAVTAQSVAVEQSAGQDMAVAALGSPWQQGLDRQPSGGSACWACMD